MDKGRRSGTERRKKWKFFDEMDQCCGIRDTSTPLSLVSSLTNDSEGENFSFMNSRQSIASTNSGQKPWDNYFNSPCKTFLSFFAASMNSKDFRIDQTLIMNA